MNQTDTHTGGSQQLEKAQSQHAPRNCKAYDALLDWVQAPFESPADAGSA